MTTQVIIKKIKLHTTFYVTEAKALQKGFHIKLSSKKRTVHKDSNLELLKM